MLQISTQSIAKVSDSPTGEFFSITFRSISDRKMEQSVLQSSVARLHFSILDSFFFFLSEKIQQIYLKQLTEKYPFFRPMKYH